jgi:hypothetical protein
MGETDNVKLTKVKGILDLVSLDRLACFGEDFDTAHPAEPWNNKFRQELGKARIANEWEPEIERKIEEALGRHFWNAGLCASLYPAVHTIEICYRNAFDNAVRRFGAADAWLKSDLGKTPLALRFPPSTEIALLRGEEQTAIEEARKFALRRYRYGSGRQVSHSDILAELDLGFWVRLTKKVPRNLWPKTGMFLDDLIPDVDKNVRTWDHLLKWLQNASELRNAIAHQHILWVSRDDETLYYHPQASRGEMRRKIRSYLKYRHDLLYDFLGAINQSVCRLVEKDDRFSEIADLDAREFFKLDKV